MLHHLSAPWIRQTGRLLSVLTLTLVLGSCAPGRDPAPEPPAPPQEPAPQAPATPEPETPRPEPPALAREVEIRRTSYGVPHILAESLEAASFGMAWVMMEDYRETVLEQILVSNGRWAAVEGRSAVGSDQARRLAHAYAEEVYPTFPTDVQDVLKGFASGVNYFVEVHRESLPDWATPDFTPQDIAARDLSVWDQGAVGRFLRDRVQAAGGSEEGAELEGADLGGAEPDGVELEGAGLDGAELERVAREEAPPEKPDPDVGSNAWAFGPDRIESGNAVLVRNPHLSYTSGYYEAHMTVPGVLNFYGDFRLGGPFTIIGGFNDHLGWSTTNNSGEPDQIYAFLKDPGDPDAFLLDGSPRPIRTEAVSVEYQDADSMAVATRDFRFTGMGPVLFENQDTVFVLKTPRLNQPRIEEQWLRMMKARNLEEWKDAMRIQAKTSSNFTYADAAGNIFYVWNATLPILPHEPSDGAPVFAERAEDVWTEVFPWDDLPQLLNPQGGYLQNANDPPYLTNLNEPISRGAFPGNFPEPRLRLRSQHSLELVHTDDVLSLEEVVTLKHSLKMLLADRVKDDLIGILHASRPSREMSEAIQAVAEWDNRVARDSRGAVLFKLWVNEYRSITDPESWYLVPWSEADPVRTPLGIGDEGKAVEAFHRAFEEAQRRFGSWDVTWGEVHRIRAGELDIPVGGCTGGLGCFRVIGYADEEDGRYRARTGDAWVLAVEFGETPRAFSVLLYGNSNQEDSPYFYNQAEMFADNRMKPVAYTESDIQRNLIERYRPGDPRQVR